MPHTRLQESPNPHTVDLQKKQRPVDSRVVEFNLTAFLQALPERISLADVARDLELPQTTVRNLGQGRQVPWLLYKAVVAKYDPLSAPRWEDGLLIDLASEPARLSGRCLTFADRYDADRDGVAIRRADGDVEVLHRRELEDPVEREVPVPATEVPASPQDPLAALDSLARHLAWAQDTITTLQQAVDRLQVANQGLRDDREDLRARLDALHPAQDDGSPLQAVIAGLPFDRLRVEVTARAERAFADMEPDDRQNVIESLSALSRKDLNLRWSALGPEIQSILGERAPCALRAGRRWRIFFSELPGLEWTADKCVRLLDIVRKDDTRYYRS